jgi:hypothetical protein
MVGGERNDDEGGPPKEERNGDDRPVVAGILGKGSIEVVVVVIHNSVSKSIDVVRCGQYGLTGSPGLDGSWK